MAKETRVVWFASEPDPLNCRAMKSLPPSGMLASPISSFLAHSEKVWSEYQQQGPNRLAPTLFEQVDLSANLLLSQIEILRDQELDRGNSDVRICEWYDQLVGVIRDVRDLAQRCVCRVEGLCFFAPEAGLIPRRNLLESYEEGLAWLRLQLVGEDGLRNDKTPLGQLQIPEFQPRLFLGNGHLQTLATVFLRTKQMPYAARQHRIPLDDGDQLVLHDDCPPTWQPHQRVVLLIHGLTGCHLSSYMVRISYKLARLGLRVFRLDMRGCGAGMQLARRSCHAGSSVDLAAAVGFINRTCPQSQLAVAGFSLGGSILLKFLGEQRHREVECVTRAIAINPPLNLIDCERTMSRTGFGIYSRYFAQRLHRQLLERQAAHGGFVLPDGYRRPRGLREFDERYTAPVAGFDNADHYYRSSSSDQFVPHIQTPTQIIASRDDPLIPIDNLLSLKLPRFVKRHVTGHGGHLAFVGRGRGDADRYWVDWRVVDWVTL